VRQAADQKGVIAVAGYVFVSYSRRDAEYVERLADYLVAQRIDVWVDRKLEHGDNWARVLAEKVDGCAAVVVVMTPDSDKSDWVQREVQRAEEESKPIFPILLRGRAFMRFNSTQYADVTDQSMPSERFIAKLREVTGPRKTLPHEPVVMTATPARPTPKQLGSGADRTWLPVARPFGRQVTFQVVGGKVWGATIQSPKAASEWLREWDAMGTGVSRLVATQTGAHLVAQSPDGLVVGRVDDADAVGVMTSVKVGRDDMRLIAARFAAPRPGFAFSAVEVLLATPSGSELWALSGSGLESRRELAVSVRAGAGTDAGFLVVTAEGNLGHVRAGSTEATTSAGLGDGWLDVDAANRADGTVFAALRRAGGSTTATCARTAEQLAAEEHATVGDIHTVRVLRQRRAAGPDATATDPNEDVWLVSDDGCTCLADLPVASARTRGHPDHIRDTLLQRRPGRGRGSVGRGAGER
jgi:hypothetical protein